MEYLQLEECKERYVYRVDSRRIGEYAVFDGEDGFIGVREKFGSEFLFREYHWDTDKGLEVGGRIMSFGTVMPIEAICALPDRYTLDLQPNRPLFDYLKDFANGLES